MIDYNFMSHCTQNFMSIWRCNKPGIGRIHGDAVAGGAVGAGRGSSDGKPPRAVRVCKRSSCEVDGRIERHATQRLVMTLHGKRITPRGSIELRDRFGVDQTVM